MDKKRVLLFPRISIGRYWMPGVLAVVVLFFLGCEGEPDRAPEPPAKAPPTPVYDGTIVAVGDSLTAGLGVSEEDAYPARLSRRLKASGYRYQVINAGVSGETSSGARSRIDWVIASLNPDIVILVTGANDGLRGIDPELVEANINAICQILKENNIEVLLAGMQMLPNLGPEYTKAFSMIYPLIAKKHSVVYMPFFLKDVAGEIQLNQPDRIHPTAEGYDRITENLYPYVLQAIERKRKSRKR